MQYAQHLDLPQEPPSHPGNRWAYFEKVKGIHSVNNTFYINRIKL